MIHDDVLVEQLKLALIDTSVRAQSARSIDAIRISPRLDALYGVILRERLRIRPLLVANEIGQVLLSDAFAVLSALYQARQVAVVDGVSIGQTQALQLAMQLTERLGMTSALAGNGTYRLAIAQGFRLATALGNFFGADVTEALGLDEALLARMLAIAGIDETLEVGAELTPQLLLHVALEDGVHLDPEFELRMLFQPTMVEGVSIEAGYLAPDGSFTTWAMNTRTGAVTEYDDYVFNSFARMGNRYLGASDAGLFELQGDDDDGADIIARIKSGYMQFGGTLLSRLKGAYIATRKDGDFILRVITAEGDRYDYAASPRNMRSTKVHMGKGLRERYFAFELISAGQDFDLDTLEFVPIVMQRRV